MTVSASLLFSPDGNLIGPDEEAEFYQSLKMRNGTFKTTSPSRFDDINPKLMEILRARLPATPEVLDVAVSTGISTVELADAFRAAGMVPSITATDLFMAAQVIRISDRLVVLADKQGWPLQYEVNGMVLRPWIRRLDYVTLAALPRAMLNAVLRPRIRQLAGRGKGTPVALVSRTLSQDAGVRLVEDDLLVARPAFKRVFNFVRVANILNIGSFTDHEMQTARENITSYMLGAGSILLVARTSHRDGANAATLFVMNEKRELNVLHKFGGGSEIEPLFLSA